jgi:hypothetical protein
MPWPIKLYDSSEEWFKAHPGLDQPIGTGCRVGDTIWVETPGGTANLANHQISGEGNNITVKPSILVTGHERIYHGFIENGILTDDCDGRVYE